MEGWSGHAVASRASVVASPSALENIICIRSEYIVQVKCEVSFQQKLHRKRAMGGVLLDISFYLVYCRY